MTANTIASVSIGVGGIKSDEYYWEIDGVEAFRGKAGILLNWEDRTVEHTLIFKAPQSSYFVTSISAVRLGGQTPWGKAQEYHPGINNLSFSEGCDHLEKVDVRQQNLHGEIVGLRDQQNLKALSLSSNELSKLDLGSLPELTSLNVSRNFPFSSLKLNECLKLGHVAADHDKRLTDSIMENLHNCINLNTMYIRHGRGFTKLDFTPFVDLKGVIVYDNAVKEITGLNDNPNLIFADIQNNPNSGNFLDLTGNENQTRLTIHNNPLTHISGLEDTQLEHFLAIGSNLSDLSGLSELTTLTKVDVWKNSELTRLDMSKWFGLSFLRTRGTGITEIIYDIKVNRKLNHFHWSAPLDGTKLPCEIFDATVNLIPDLIHCN